MNNDHCVCWRCNGALQPQFFYCPGCGADVTESSKTTGLGWGIPSLTQRKANSPCTSQAAGLSFKDFLKNKSLQRQNVFQSKTKRRKSFDDEEVSINIGIMTQNSDGTPRIVRGKVLPLKINKQSNASEVFEAALEKRKKHDHTFRKDREYKLLYPDGQIVNNLPGIDEPFTLMKYKEDIGKQFARITLYLSSTLKQGSESEEETDKLNDTNSSISQFTTWHQSGNDLNDSNKQSDSCTRCPICNKQFPINEIEEHADVCLLLQQNPFSCYSAFTGPGDDACSSTAGKLPDDNPILDNTDKATIVNDIKECLCKVSFQEHETEPMTIFVRRDYSFKDFYDFFQKPWNKKKINQSFNIAFVGECGVDTGGVKRDFFSGALASVKRLFFEGNDNDGYAPSCGLQSVADGTARAIGHLFAASICCGGPGPGFLKAWCYRYLTEGVTGLLKNLPPDGLPYDSIFSQLFKEVTDADTDEGIQRILSSKRGCNMLETIGFRGNPMKSNLTHKKSVLESIFMHSVQHLTPVLNEFLLGLKSYDFSSQLLKKPDLFKHVFCPSPFFQWDLNLLVNHLHPCFAEDGGNKKSKETATFKAFVDMAEQCYYDNQSPFSFLDLMRFLTGTVSVPPLGLPHHEFTINFVHACSSSCRCLPKVSTCALVIHLPVHIASMEEMKEAFQLALTCEVGFGCV